jgi:hypothetical protein
MFGMRSDSELGSGLLKLKSSLLVPIKMIEATLLKIISAGGEITSK